MNMHLSLVGRCMDFLRRELQYRLDLQFIFLVVFVFLSASFNLCIVATVFLVYKGCLQLA